MREEREFDRQYPKSYDVPECLIRRRAGLLQALGYTVVVLICAVVLFWVIGMIVARFGARPMLGPGL